MPPLREHLSALPRAARALVVAPQATGHVDAALVLALIYNGLDVICVVPALLLLAGARRGLPIASGSP